jgi:FkbM family methyltransferase
MKKIFISLLKNLTRIGLVRFTLSDSIMSYTKTVSHNNINIDLVDCNYTTRYRIDTFASKEPETLQWIDTFDPNSVLWDIGANVGLYTCYASKTKNCTVYAFEPSFFNLELLARNIFNNDLQSKVTVLPVALSNSNSTSKFSLSTTTRGGALSTFDKDYGHDGNPLESKFVYNTVGFTCDNILSSLNLKSPDYIKIDVDGIEHLILEGSRKTLESVKSILVEINDDFKEQENTTRIFLESCNFNLLHKKHSAMFDKQGAFGDGKVWNQIWVKNH